MRLHLTDIAVRAFKLGARRTYWDDTTPGFGIRVGHRAKTWTVMRGLDRERVSLGRYPDLTLSDARAAAKKLLASEPEPKLNRITFKEAKLEFLEDNYRDCTPRTKHEATRLLASHFSKLDGEYLAQVADAHIKKQLDKIGNRPSEQLHAYRVIRCFLRWCTRPPRRYIKHSPMEGYQPPGKDRKGTRALTDPELRAVWKAADKAPYSAVRLLILWGTRNAETAASGRPWLADEVLTIPGSHTKNGRDHAIPILPVAAQVIATLPLTGYFFPSRWGESHMAEGAWGKLKREIQKKSGTKDWKLRDIRRTFRSNMAKLKVPRDLAEIMINHAPPVLDEIYDRYDRLTEKRDALERYEQYLLKVVGIC